MRRICIFMCVVLWASTSMAVNYIFDEFLFSKDTWHSWKLDNPLEEFNPSDLLPKAKENFPGYELAEFNSLDGPRPRLPPTQKAINSGGTSDVDALDDETMVEPASKAAQCTTCHVLVSVVWNRLVTHILSGETVIQATVKENLADACEKDALDAVLRKHTILKMESTAAVPGGGGGPGGEVATASLLFFVVRERRDGSRGVSATEAEEEAISLACKTLVQEHGDDLTSVLMTQLANFRKEALRLLVKHDRDGGNSQDELPVAADAGAASPPGSGSNGQLPRLGGPGGSGASSRADDDDDYVDPDDLDDEGDVKPGGGGGGARAVVRGGAGGLAKAVAAKAGKGGPGGVVGAASSTGSSRRAVRGLTIKVKPGEPQCEDLNPMCGGWAASGECQSNPNFMIGTDKHRGQCRKSCGVCQPDDVLSSAPALSAALDSVSAALLLAVKNLGCGAGGPCLNGVSGMAMSSGIIAQHQSAKKELPAGMKELPGGFVLGKPWWGQPDIVTVPLAMRVPLPASADTAAAPAPAADGGADGGAAAAGGPGGSPGGADGGAATATATASAPSHSDVDRVLGPALAHKLLSIPSDFFTYEYLYKNHSRQYHADRDGDITEEWLLGRFTRESVALMSSATGEVAGLEELDLLPGSSQAQQLKAHSWPYVKQVYAGGDECVLAGGRRVVRRVEARIACSPDSGTYMLVREPDFCSYTFVIYVPQLCALDYYKPRPKAGSGRAATAGGGGGNTAEGAGGEGVRKRRRGAVRT